MIDTQDSSIISSKPSILQYMREAVEQEHTFIISPTRTDIYKEYKTNLIKVDQEKNQLILQKLIPEDWPSYISKDDNVEVRCLLDDGSISFTAEIEIHQDADDNTCCQIQLPEQVKKNQLRSFFRVSLAESQTNVSFPIFDGTVLKGICQNISLAGCLLQLNTFSNQISKGDLIDKCKLVIPEVLDITFCAQVCFVQQVQPHTKLVGIKFMDLKLFQFNAIRTTMDKMERLRLQKNTPIMFH